MRVLVTGAAGRLGREVVRAFADDGPVFGLSRTALNVADRKAVHAAIASCTPSLVVNCAAWTDVDGCEGDPQRAQRINAAAVGYLREAAEEVGAHLLHVSTDFVFDGKADVPYREDDLTAPLNVYGSSKLAGEEMAGPEARATMRRSTIPGASAGCSQLVRTTVADGPAATSPASLTAP